MRGIHFSLNCPLFLAVSDERRIWTRSRLVPLTEESLESVQSVSSIRTGGIPLSRFSSFELEERC